MNGWPLIGGHEKIFLNIVIHRCDKTPAMCAYQKRGPLICVFDFYTTAQQQQLSVGVTVFALKLKTNYYINFKPIIKTHIVYKCHLLLV